MPHCHGRGGRRPGNGRFIHGAVRCALHRPVRGGRRQSLAAAATTQYSAIISKLEALEALYVAPGSGGGGGSGSRGNRNFISDDRAKSAARINQLQAAICGSWITGPASKFCSKHGWGLVPGHDSMSCKNKTKEGEPGGHVNTATRSNPVGPGKNKNKGWDDFVT